MDDVIAQFMKQYQRIFEQRLNAKDQEFVMDMLKNEQFRADESRQETGLGAAARETEDLVDREPGQDAVQEPSSPITANNDRNLQETSMAQAKDQSTETPDPFQGFAEAENARRAEANLAKDQVRNTTDPALAVPDAEKARNVEKDAEVVEQKSFLVGQWAAEMKSSAADSLYRGQGATDELSVKSAGQYSTNFSQQVRPGSTQADLESAVERMGLGPQVERQKAQESGNQKGADQARDQGQEAER